MQFYCATHERTTRCVVMNFDASIQCSNQSNSNQIKGYFVFNLPSWLQRVQPHLRCTAVTALSTSISNTFTFQNGNNLFAIAFKSTSTSNNVTNFLFPRLWWNSNGKPQCNFKTIKFTNTLQCNHYFDNEFMCTLNC